jgi:hypothetical protein
MDTQYSFLRMSVLITKILSYVVAGLSFIAALIILFGKTSGTGKLASLGVLVMGGIYFLIFYLASDIIRLLMDIQERMQKIETAIQPVKKEIR